MPDNLNNQAIEYKTEIRDLLPVNICDRCRELAALKGLRG